MRRQLRAAAIGVATVLSVSTVAPATFIGLEVVDITDNDDGLMEYALYAVFDDPTDVLLIVFFADITTTTGFFHNSIGGIGQSALPFTEFETGISDNPDADSFVTIGLMTGDDNATMLFGSFDEDAFINGNSVIGAWFNPFAPNGQGVPGPNGEVLIAVFTPLNDANGVPGMIGGTLTVGFSNPDLPPGQSGSDSFFIPAPGSLALLALAALAPRRRREFQL